MNGIAQLSLVNMRAEPSSKSELVNQLLFGETYVVHNQQGEWLHVSTLADNYSGFINVNQHTELPELITNKNVVSIFPHVLIQNNNNQTYLLPGSLLAEPTEYTNYLNLSSMLALGKQFLGAPYLWGGKSYLGIDCSGFTQVLFRCGGVFLPRDAYQQAAFGEIIDFVTSALPGDLAFFENEDGKITHVGMVLDNNKIIHASGYVRIDDLDSHGIFNRYENKHTHKLKVIKRISLLH
jgi:hypothetical protein